MLLSLTDSKDRETNQLTCNLKKVIKFFSAANITFEIKGTSPVQTVPVFFSYIALYSMLYVL